MSLPGAPYNAASDRHVGSTVPEPDRPVKAPNPCRLVISPPWPCEAQSRRWCECRDGASGPAELGLRRAGSFCLARDAFQLGPLPAMLRFPAKLRALGQILGRRQARRHFRRRTYQPGSGRLGGDRGGVGWVPSRRRLGRPNNLDRFTVAAATWFASPR